MQGTAGTAGALSDQRAIESTTVVIRFSRADRTSLPSQRPHQLQVSRQADRSQIVLVYYCLSRIGSYGVMCVTIFQCFDDAISNFSRRKEIDENAVTAVANDFLDRRRP